jgi:GT2 family glycosyltransferase
VLANCLHRLAPSRQSLYGMDYEVLVSDAGAEPRSAAAMCARFPWVEWHPASGAGPAANRNAGARHARGEWLVFVDDDCLPDPGWLPAIHAAVTKGDVDVVEGRTTVPNERDHPLYYAPYNATGGLYWTCNLAVRKDVFTRLGGFDEDLAEQCEDMEFAHRITRAGLRTVFRPDAVVWHPMRRVGWRGLVAATLRMRWHVMYRLKTNQAAPLGSSRLTASAHLAASTFANLLRTTAHLVTRHDPAHWRTKWFWQVWSWLTFPALLPYLLVWDGRFRRILVERARQ